MTPAFDALAISLATDTLLDEIKTARWALCGKEVADGRVWQDYRQQWSKACRELCAMNGGRPMLTCHANRGTNAGGD